MDTAMTNDVYVPPVVTMSLDHQNLCNSNLRFANDLKPLIDDVKACGVDCSAYAALLEHLEVINREVKVRFCDNKPLPGM